MVGAHICLCVWSYVLMMSLCVSVCLSMGGFSGGLMHGCVWWGCAQSRLSVSGLMCLHDVACCLGVSSMGAFDGVGMVLSLCVWCYLFAFTILTDFLFVTSSTHQF